MRDAEYGPVEEMPTHMVPLGDALNSRLVVAEHKVAQLEAENRSLHEEVKRLQQERRSEIAGAAQLRRVLMPLKRGLEMIFDELPAEDVAVTVPEAATSRMDALWESWKKRLPGRPAEMIDALREHGPMDVPAIRLAIKCGQQTVYDTASKLLRAGVIEKAGGKYSLKRIE